MKEREFAEVEQWLEKSACQAPFVNNAVAVRASIQVMSITGDIMPCRGVHPTNKCISDVF